MADALKSVGERGIVGAAVTPHVLAEISKGLDGRNVPANLALSESNARVAGEVAVELS